MEINILTKMEVKKMLAERDKKLRDEFYKSLNKILVKIQDLEKIMEVK